MGLNLLIYPSPLSSPGRVGKIGRSLQATGLFGKTEIVGIQNNGMPDTTPIAPDVEVVRIPGPNVKDFMGGLRIMMTWPIKVYRRYRNCEVCAVAAQNVYLLPLASSLSRKTGAVFAYNAHELETETIGARGLKKAIAKFIERRYIYKTDVVSVVNESIAEWYEKHYPGVHPVVVTNSPVAIEGQVDLHEALEIPDDELIYIHVGYLMEGRSIPLLLEEFASRPRIHLVFLGDGEMRPIVEDAARNHPNIHLFGVVSPDEVVPVVRGADIGLNLIEHVSLSSQLSTPNKMMEALAAGIPPLSTDLPEARRYLGSELSETWILESPETDLAIALDKISRQDLADFKAKRTGIASWDSQARKLVTAYKVAMNHHDTTDNES